MAIKNRAEAKVETSASLVATLTLAELITLWNDELNETYLFRKDIIASETPAGGAVTIDYSDKDTATVTFTENTAVSFTNIENGDVKYLHITKAAAYTVSFAGATDTSKRKLYIDSEVTVVIYQVFNKNGVILVNSINIDNDVTTVFQKTIEIGDWNMNTTTITSIVHNVADWTKIINVSALIFIDDDDAAYPLSQNLEVADDPTGFGAPVVSGAYAVNATTIVLSRTTGGWYDAAAWDKTSYNRGYIVINYLP